MPKSKTHLRRCRVLITRPQHSARGLVDAITARGGTPVHIPALAIAPLQEDERGPVLAMLKQLPLFEHIIFTSANAVRCSFALLDELGWEFPRTARCYAVGPVTRQALSQHGVKKALVHGVSSESMAQMPELGYVYKQRVLIVCGVDTRPWLGEHLRGRGAEVHYCAVSRRLCPGRSGPPLRKALRGGAVDATLAASAETLQNLVMLAGSTLPLLRELPLCVPGERVAEQARARNFRVVLSTEDARDEQMVKELAGYWTYWMERSAENGTR